MQAFEIKKSEFGMTSSNELYQKFTQLKKCVPPDIQSQLAYTDHFGEKISFEIVNANRTIAYFVASKEKLAVKNRTISKEALRESLQWRNRKGYIPKILENYIPIHVQAVNSLLKWAISSPSELANRVIRLPYIPKYMIYVTIPAIFSYFSSKEAAMYASYFYKSLSTLVPLESFIYIVSPFFRSCCAIHKFSHAVFDTLFWTAFLSPNYTDDPTRFAQQLIDLVVLKLPVLPEPQLLLLRYLATIWSSSQIWELLINDLILPQFWLQFNISPFSYSNKPAFDYNLVHDMIQTKSEYLAFPDLTNNDKANGIGSPLDGSLFDICESFSKIDEPLSIYIIMTAADVVMLRHLFDIDQLPPSMKNLDPLIVDHFDKAHDDLISAYNNISLSNKEKNHRHFKIRRGTQSDSDREDSSDDTDSTLDDIQDEELNVILRPFSVKIFPKVMEQIIHIDPKPFIFPQCKNKPKDEQFNDPDKNDSLQMWSAIKNIAAERAEDPVVMIMRETPPQIGVSVIDKKLRQKCETKKQKIENQNEPNNNNETEADKEKTEAQNESNNNETEANTETQNESNSNNETEAKTETQNDTNSNNNETEADKEKTETQNESNNNNNETEAKTETQNESNSNNNETEAKTETQNKSNSNNNETEADKEKTETQNEPNSNNETEANRDTQNEISDNNNEHGNDETDSSEHIETDEEKLHKATSNESNEANSHCISEIERFRILCLTETINRMNAQSSQFEDLIFHQLKASNLTEWLDVSNECIRGYSFLLARDILEDEALNQFTKSHDIPRIPIPTDSQLQSMGSSPPSPTSCSYLSSPRSFVRKKSKSSMDSVTNAPTKPSFKPKSFVHKINKTVKKHKKKKTRRGSLTSSILSTSVSSTTPIKKNWSAGTNGISISDGSPIYLLSSKYLIDHFFQILEKGIISTSSIIKTLSSPEKKKNENVKTISAIYSSFSSSYIRLPTSMSDSKSEEKPESAVFGFKNCEIGATNFFLALLMISKIEKTILAPFEDEINQMKQSFIQLTEKTKRSFFDNTFELPTFDSRVVAKCFWDSCNILCNVDSESSLLSRTISLFSFLIQIDKITMAKGFSSTLSPLLYASPTPSSLFGNEMAQKLIKFAITQGPDCFWVVITVIVLNSTIFGDERINKYIDEEATQGWQGFTVALLKVMQDDAQLVALYGSLATGNRIKDMIPDRH